MKSSYRGKLIHMCLKFVCDTVQHTVTDVLDIR